MMKAAPDSDQFMAVQESISADEVENEVYDSSDKVYSTGAVATEAGAGSEQDNGASADVTMRQVECPIAFFMPTLSTDADGLCSLDFTAPGVCRHLAVAGVGLYHADERHCVDS